MYLDNNYFADFKYSGLLPKVIIKQTFRVCLIKIEFSC